MTFKEKETLNYARERVRRAKSVLLLIINDLSNPEGALIEEETQLALELIVESLDCAINDLNN